MAMITMGAFGEAAEDIGVSYYEVRLRSLHKRIIGWDADESMIWDREPEVACRFLRAVDEVQKIIGDLGEGQEELLRYGRSVLHIGMSRLQDEFVHVLAQNQQPVAPDLRMSDTSFRSTLDDSLNYSSSRSFDEESIQGKLRSESSTGSEEFAVDLVHPDAVLDLKSIARTMFRSKYDTECCQAYTSVRKDALDERLSALRMERLSIEEVLEMDWRDLSSMIRRWCRALKVFVRVYLASEKRLCELVFGDLPGPKTDYFFRESSKRSILQLLGFGEAVAIGSPRPEKLFRVLDMHEALSDLVTDIESLFPDEAAASSSSSSSSVVAECDHVLFRLSECARGTFAEFKIAIRSSASATPFPGGGVHPLTKYVMNYVKALVDYNGTLNLLLRSEDENDHHHISTPLARHLQSVASILEENLGDRSALYKDGAIQSLFKMNNICYMVQKVKDSSELRAIIGDDWVRSYRGKSKRYATSYERASWGTVLSFLKDEGVCSRGSNNPSRAILKERFKGFNIAFEEVYRAQTGWIVPNLELREDLRISISVKLLQAYRTFVGRYASHLDGARRRDSYVKYCPEDLEGCLLDLFEGVPKVMHPHRRR